MPSSSSLEAIRWRGVARKPPAAAGRACILFAVLALAFTALLFVLPRPAQAQAQQAVRGEASFTSKDGYGRLILRFTEPMEAQARIAGGILVVSFRKPVAVAVDRINVGQADWIGAARRDPDGRAIRFALARKVRVNTIAAAERLFIDLIPEGWTAALPSLPVEVVEELARRTTAAERAAREQAELAEKQRKVPPIRVRVASHATFTRYVFALPELTGVSTSRQRDKLTLSFARPLEFDLSEAKLSSPPAVQSIDTVTPQDETTAVRFAFGGEVDIRTFREDFNYVVDVTPLDKSAKGKGAPLIEPPETMPARAAEPSAPPAVAPAASTAAAMPGVGDAPPAAPPDAVPAPAAEPPPRDPAKPVKVELRRHGESLRMAFPFAVPTPTAAFMRADTLWLVFDTPAKLDLTVLDNEPSRTVRSVSAIRKGDAQIVRLKLERPRLASLVTDGAGWLVTLADGMDDQSKPLGLARNIVGPGRTSVTVAFDDPRSLHWIDDPEIGDTLLVVTGLGPARGLLKTQTFVDFRALASTHGVVVQRIADDLSAELSADKVLLGRPGGLTLSQANAAARRPGLTRAVTFDSQSWGFDRTANFAERQIELIAAAAEAPPARRTAPRLELARFYLSRQMFAEAKAVLDVAIADDAPTPRDPSPLVLRAVANIMLERSDAALKDLANPIVGNQYDAALWRAVAQARQGKWAEAREGFRHVEGAMGTLPLELQRLALADSLRASIEVGDFATGAIRLNDFETVGVPPELEPEVAVLTGRLAEGLGRREDALASYQYAAQSKHRPSAAAGRLREAALRYGGGEMKKPELIDELERLTIGWRGDETEVEALRLLSGLYIEDERYRDAFTATRIAMTQYPNSDVARRIQDASAATFDALFLGGKADALPAIDALSLFYDFRELTPIGRRGDEMIRRLADRLVSVDLLDQAAELLQHQVDNRLQGAARAQVAARLAVIYLLNRKPDRAQAALRATRSADLSNEVRSQRLLLEARALSDLGRHEMALEVIAGMDGREAVRLRSDIHWAARQWQKAAEQIELLHGQRWKDFQPLSETERSDILRAAVGFALADDSIGNGRLRERYGAKMGDGPDRRAFTLATGGLGPNSAEFRDVARTIAQVDTLEGFLRDLRTRYPEMNTLAPPPATSAAPPAKGDSTGSLAEK